MDHSSLPWGVTSSSSACFPFSAKAAFRAASITAETLRAFSTISLILLGENPENRIGIILVSKTIKVDYDQVRKELIELEVNGDGGDD